MDNNTTDTNRTRRITIRLTEQEYLKLVDGLRHSIDRKLSDYARKLLLGKPVKILTRNKSLDIFTEEMAHLRKEMNALGNNFNQVVRRLNSIRELPQQQFWLRVAQDMQQQLLEKTETIQSKIIELSPSWYQNS